MSGWQGGGRLGHRPGIYLVTFTAPHSGDIEVDRDRMGKSIRRLLKVANAAQWWRHYALVWECTPGRDGKGHLHAHLACVSQWIPYVELHEAWRAASPGAVMLDVKAPRGGDRKAPGKAAHYLSKYVTKGVQPSDMTGQKAGELLVAQYGKRRVTTSRHFWIEADPSCKTCGRRCYLAAAPVGLRQHAPGGVLNAMVTALAPRLREREWAVKVRWNADLREMEVLEVTSTARRHPQKRMLD